MLDIRTATMFLIYVIAAVIGLAVVVGLNIPWRWKLRRFPGPTPWLFLGNLSDFVRLLPTGAHGKWYGRHGSVYVMYMGALPFIVVRDADMVHEILVKQFKNFPGRAVTAAPLGSMARRVFFNNIFVTKGALWSTVRSTVQPLFHSTSLRKFALGMREAVDRMAALLAHHVTHDVSKEIGTAGGEGWMETSDAASVSRRAVKAGKGAITLNAVASDAKQLGMDCSSPYDEVNIQSLFCDLAFEALGPLVYGISCESTAASKQQLHAAVIEAAKLLLNTPLVPSIFTAAAMALPRAAVPMLAWLSKRFKTAASKEVEAGRVMIAGAAYGLMNAARQRHNLPAFTPDPDFIPATAVINTGMVPEEGTLLDLLVQARHKETKEPLSDIQIVPQANAFLIAGHESTGGTLSLAVYLIAQNPTVEQTLRRELQQHADMELDSAEACEKLVFTQACIKETLRMMPIVPLTNRIAACDTIVGGWRFPEGVGVTIDIAGLHRDSRYWSDPNQFKPERFLDGKEPAHPMAFIPFGAGPRVCIGMRFAMQEATIALARLYSRFTFRLSPRYEHEPLAMRFNVTCIPKYGVWVSVNPASAVVC